MLIRSYFKSVLATLILFAIVMALFVQIPTTRATESNMRDETLTFIRDVVKLDMSFYTTTLIGNDVYFPSHLNGMAEEEVLYALDWKNESVIQVTCRFREDKLYGYSVHVMKGTPTYVEQQTTNAIDTVKGILDRYLVYSQAEYVKVMQIVLSSVSSTNMTTTLGNVKLVASTVETPWGTTQDIFEWIYTINGIAVQQNALTITLEDGLFTTLQDTWGLYKIGSSSVNISQEEAVAIARKAATDYTLEVWLGEWVEVPFNLRDDYVSVDFFTYPREALTAFPLWDIEVYFDKSYYSVQGLRFGIWADTGEIAFCNELSYGGGSIDEITPLPQQSNGSNWYILAVFVAIIAVIVISTVMLRKK